jgi:hypothetical protein
VGNTVETDSLSGMSPLEKPCMRDTSVFNTSCFDDGVVVRDVPVPLCEVKYMASHVVEAH